VNLALKYQKKGFNTRKLSSTRVKIRKKKIEKKTVASNCTIVPSKITGGGTISVLPFGG
jgi:predicted GNAT family acetyltransferase